MMEVEVITEKDLKYHIIEMLKSLKATVQSGDLIISGNVFKDPVQKVLVNFNRSDWFSNTIIPIIVVNAIDCEKYAPGAGKIFLDLIVNDLDSFIRKNLVFNFNDESLLDVIRLIETNSSGLCDQEDYRQYIDENLRGVSKDLVERTLGIYRSGDQVIVEKNLVRHTTIDKRQGYVFDNVTISKFFLQSGSWKRNNVNVILIDGIIESVGEIHHLLEKAHETSESYLIICPGILPEPLNVIQNNFSRKTIDVVVGTVDSNEFGIQTMVDLGSCCLTEPICALKGETISQASRREMIKVDRIEAFPNKLTIVNPGAKHVTDLLLQDVLKRTEENSDLAYLYQKRVRSLISSTVKVSIGRDDIDRNKHIVEEVDLFFRTTPMSLKWGFVKKSDVCTLPNEILCLLFERSNVQPTHRIKKSLETYLSFRDQVNRTGAIITKQRE